jgi:hypothetical protein
MWVEQRQRLCLVCIEFCRIGGLVLVVVPKGFIEGRIVFEVLGQGGKVLQRLKEYTRSDNADGDEHGITEKQEEMEMLANQQV